jgi:4-hydroxy-2-oxoheptanedioate aldolase
MKPSLSSRFEDPEAVDCIDNIAAVEEIDSLLVGPANLAISYAVSMQREHCLIQGAMDRVANAAAKAGRGWGL